MKFFLNYSQPIKPIKKKSVNNQIRIFLYGLLFIGSAATYSQNFTYRYFTEEGDELSRKEFFQPNDNNNYSAVYFEKDSLIFGVRYRREKYGTLEDSTFQKVKDYLNTLKEEPIGENDMIVINFLSYVNLEEQKKKTPSNWNIFNREYLRKLKKIDNVSQFWISRLPSEQMKHFTSERIDWKQDKQGIIPEVFSPYGLEYGYYVILTPRGDYYYYIGEYGKDRVWKMTEEMRDFQNSHPK
ncbi:hypothetical protein E0K83_02880 [Gramella sp. BOM4]|nr:hypothetical protein [Christiangramia bathymodioli]